MRFLCGVSLWWLAVGGMAADLAQVSLASTASAAVPSAATSTADAAKPAEITASSNHWLVPLLAAASRPVANQPALRIADLERDRARLYTDQAASAWSPELSMAPNYSENRYMSTSSVDGKGIVADRTTNLNSALSESFASGTGVRLEANSTRADTTNASSLLPVYYTSAVRATLTQALLDGSGTDANQADWRNRIDQESQARDQAQRRRAELYAALAEDWLNLAQREGEQRLRREHEELTKRALSDFEERAKLGKVSALNLASLRRDVVGQENSVNSAQRDIEQLQSRIRVLWATVVLPNRDRLVEAEAGSQPASWRFTDTTIGRIAMSRITMAGRTMGAADRHALDKLDLFLSYGKNGTDDTWAGSIQQLDGRDTYQWSTGLNWVHRFGLDAQRLEYQRAVLALDQARYQADDEERHWQTEDLRLRQELADSHLRWQEALRVLAAYRAEVDLIRAEVERGTLLMKDLANYDQYITWTQMSVLGARLDALRWELRLRLHEDRLLELESAAVANVVH